MTMSESERPNDLLLLAGRLLAILMQGLMAIAAAGILFALVGVPFFADDIDAAMAEEFGASAMALPVAPTLGLLATVLVVVVCIFFFFKRLRQIVETVGRGDPFAPENAARLTAMAWLALAAQLLMYLAKAFALQVEAWVRSLEEATLQVDVSLDIEGIVLVIVLFILARVFRHGTAMREDLEGTV